MNKLSFLTLGLCALLAAPSFAEVNHKPVRPDTSSYVVTSNMALWLSPTTGKLRLTIDQQPCYATIRIMNRGKVLYTTPVDVRKQAVGQTFDLSLLPQGLYEVAIITSNGTVSKKIAIQDKPGERLISLS